MSVLWSLRPYARRYIGPESEYRIRRMLLRSLPRASDDSKRHLLHCCVWKTASQWVRLVLSDPRFYWFSGRLPYFVTDLPSVDVLSKNGTILTSLYWNYGQFDEFRAQTGAAKAIFVVRDPRDLLVSWYYSTRYSHDPSPIVQERRARMEGLDEENGIKATIEDFAEIGGILQSWAEEGTGDEDVLIVRFEELTGVESIRTWEAVFSHYGVKVPPLTIRKILDFYDFSKIRGRSMSSKSPNKYRSGRPGEWREKISDGNLVYFEDCYGDLIEAFGYRKS